MEDFKLTNQADTHEKAEQTLRNFILKCKKITSEFGTEVSLLAFLEFSSSICSNIYFTTVIESFKKHLKIFKKLKYPNRDALDVFLITQFLFSTIDIMSIVIMVLPMSNYIKIYDNLDQVITIVKTIYTKITIVYFTNLVSINLQYYYS